MTKKKFRFNNEDYDTNGYTVKKYLDEPTELKLSDKAQRLYDETSPMEIYEIINNETGEIEYWMDSALNVEKGLTADDLNDDLEQIYDEFHREN